MAPAQPELAGSCHNAWKKKHLCRPQPSWAVSGLGGPGPENLGLACGTQDQKRGGAGNSLLPIAGQLALLSGK